MNSVTSQGVGTELALGWRKVLAALIGVGLGSTAIFFYSLGLFIRPLQAEFGWSRSQAVAMATIFGFTMALSHVIFGRLIDRFGVRPVSVVSILSLSAGFWCLSRMSGELNQFALIILFIAIFGSGTVTPYVRLVAGWFDKARGLAIGITMAGSGIAALIVPPVLGAYLQTNGWRAAYEALALVSLAALPLILLWGTERSLGASKAAVAAIGLTFGEAVRTRSFWLLGVSFALAGAAVSGLLPHFIPMLQDAGMTPSKAGALFGIVGLAVVAGRLITGFLCDRMFAPFVAAGVVGLSAIGCLGLLFIGVPFAPAAALLIGLGLGAEIDLVAYMCARYFGFRAYGSVIGLQYGLFAVGAGGGPILYGVLRDHFGNYDVALVVATACLVFSILCVLGLGRYPDQSESCSPAAALEPDTRPA